MSGMNAAIMTCRFQSDRQNDEPMSAAAAAGGGGVCSEWSAMSSWTCLTADESLSRRRRRVLRPRTDLRTSRRPCFSLHEQLTNDALLNDVDDDNGNGALDYHNNNNETMRQTDRQTDSTHHDSCTTRSELVW